VKEITMEAAVKPKRIKAGVYRVAGNLILVKTPDRCLRLTGHNRRGDATKKCETWKMYKTCLDDAEVIDVLGVTSTGNLFGGIIVEEFESKADALRAVASAIQKYA
jgi:hypothetical protein